MKKRLNVCNPVWLTLGLFSQVDTTECFLDFLLQITYYQLYHFQALTIPVFEGDDLRRLVNEITLCRKFLLQARSYRYAIILPLRGKIKAGVDLVSAFSQLCSYLINYYWLRDFLE